MKHLIARQVEDEFLTNEELYLVITNPEVITTLNMTYAEAVEFNKTHSVTDNFWHRIVSMLGLQIEFQVHYYDEVYLFSKRHAMVTVH